MFDEMHRKSTYLSQHRCQDLISKTFQKVRNHFVKPGPNIAAGVLKGIQLDICYLLFRNLSWIHAPALTDLGADYLSSEYQISSQLSFDLIESAIEILLAYVPIENNWTTEDYDQNFLRHILVASAIAKSDEDLRIDLGFGRSMLTLLGSVADQDQVKTNGFTFSSEIATTLNKVMDEISNELKVSPWIIDLYKLRECLEEGNFQKNIATSEDALAQYYLVLETINWRGFKLKTMASKFTFPVGEIIERLESLRLVYKEGTGIYSILKLSRRGLDIISGKVCYQLLKGNLNEIPIRKLPEPIQVRFFAELEVFKITEAAMHCAPQFWLPKSISTALRRLIGWEKQSALDLLKKLPHNVLNSWAKSEICAAVAIFPICDEVSRFLDLATKDESKRVRESARNAINQWGLRNRTTQPKNEHTKNET